MYKPVSKKGFTLIELLVVIAVVGVISGVILQSLNSARVKSRNAQRIMNVDQIVKGFHIAVTGFENKLPFTNATWRCLGKTTCWGTAATNLASVDTVLARGIQTPATDQIFKTGEWGDVVVYISNFSGGIGGSGIVFPAGAYLAWIMEDQTGAQNETCGSGSWWYNTDAGTSRPSYECLLRLGDSVTN